MTAIVIEHVPVAELPVAWRDRLAPSNDALVTMRIEEEPRFTAADEDFATRDPAFGIWRDRADLGDVDAYLRQLREPRYVNDGSRKVVDEYAGQQSV